MNALILYYLKHNRAYVRKEGRNHIFCPSERSLPRIRIETEQAELLARQRIIVVIDTWPRNSRYPLGHYVRTVGPLGDKETENEVILLEHDIPHAPFSQAVIDCLPPDDWKPDLQAPRVDLRHLTICSVDPPGCTDIDDALHCRSISEDLLEVYMCDRRIDMLPNLLSGRLCSLQGGEERYAFSVVWTMTRDATVLSAKFHKSLFKSSAALTYEKAQNIIDDANQDDDVAKSLRGLMSLSKKLKERRMGNGALTLASSEIRFDLDEDKTPTGVQAKKALDTNSMVEEFMLLANISVAEKILAEYPDCALLRRHPVSKPESYKPLVELAKQRGFEISVESGKALSDSLNRCVDPKNPELNRLIRMMTTRCMTQALYFCAGTVPLANYLHFGLASPIFTN